MLCKKKKNLDEWNDRGNKFCIRMLRKKKKNRLDKSNETVEGTNFVLEYYEKKKKNRLYESNETAERKRIGEENSILLLLHLENSTIVMDLCNHFDYVASDD